MRGETSVDEREIGVEQPQRAEILLQHGIEQQFRLARHRLAQILGEGFRVRCHGLELAQEQPLRGEVLDQGTRLRIGEHPGHLAFERLRLAEPARRRDGQ